MRRTARYVLLIGALSAMGAYAFASTSTVRTVNTPSGTLPRSVRNRNPGNIKKSGEQWQGKIAGADTVFETFETVDYGIRAMILNMRTQHMRGYNTVAKMVARWSTTDQAPYTAYVAQKCGIDPGAVMSWANPLWARVAYWMAAYEAGSETYWNEFDFYKWKLQL